MYRCINVSMYDISVHCRQIEGLNYLWKTLQHGVDWHEHLENLSKVFPSLHATGKIYHQVEYSCPSRLQWQVHTCQPSRISQETPVF